MKTLPDLDNLSVGDKDELMRTLFAQVQQVPIPTGQVAALTAKIAGLKDVWH